MKQKFSKVLAFLCVLALAVTAVPAWAADGQNVQHIEFKDAGMVEVGKSINITPEIYVEGGGEYTGAIKCYSSDESIFTAEVAESGKTCIVTGKKEGVAVLTVEAAEQRRETMGILVVKEGGSLTVEPATLTMTVGEELFCGSLFTFKIGDSEVSGVGMGIETTDASIVSVVPQQQRFKAEKVGTATLRMKLTKRYGNVGVFGDVDVTLGTVECAITVVAPSADKITVEPSELKLHVGQHKIYDNELKFFKNGEALKGNIQLSAFTSSNENIVSVDPTMHWVNAEQVGTADLSMNVIVDGKPVGTATCKVTVEEAPQRTLTVEPAELVMEVYADTEKNDTKQWPDDFTFKLDGQAIENKNISKYSAIETSDKEEKVVKIDRSNGQIVAVGAGTATLTMTVDVNQVEGTPAETLGTVTCKVTVKEHVHEYTEKTTKEPTCTEPGEKTLTCSCGDVQTKEIPALGHKGGEATCTEKAVCTQCGEAYGEVNPDNHPEGKTELQGKKGATCEAGGYTGDKVCTACGKTVEKGAETEALGHSYTFKVTTAPTAEAEGERTYTCTRCGHSYTETIPVLPEGHEHHYTEEQTTAPTCVQSGVKTCTCEECGDSYTEAIAPDPNAHDFGEREVTKEATETEEGEAVYTCVHCGFKKTEVIPKVKKPGTSDNNTGSTGTPGIVVTPSEPDTNTPSTPGAPTAAELAKDGWIILGGGKFKHKDADGNFSTGSRWIESNGVGHRYIFGTDGILQTGKVSAAGTTATAAGEILLGGNLYYLNPKRDVNDPRTCYVMTDYLQIRDNYAGQTYFDKDGITFQGWMKNAEGGLRYQTRIPRPDQATDLYLIVWRVQDLPACQHPDHPGDPAYYLPAGRYFFDDEGVLVQKEGWNDGKDGKEYYTNAQGMVTQERAK